jgi:hypothetical protein
MCAYARRVDLLEDPRKERRDCVDDIALRARAPVRVDGVVEAHGHSDLTAAARDVRGKCTAEDVDAVRTALDGRDVHGGSKRGLRSSGDLEQTSIRACPDPRARRRRLLGGRARPSRLGSSCGGCERPAE